MAKIELPECWAGVAGPLRALMAEVEREARDAIRATVRARIAAAQAAQALAPKRQQ